MSHTPIDLNTDALKRLAASITPGKWLAEEKIGPQSEWGRANIGVWSVEKYEDSDAADHGDDPMDDAWLCGIWGQISDEDKANASAIALVPDLLAEVIALRAEAERLEANAAAAEADADRLAAALAFSKRYFVNAEVLNALAAHTQRVNTKEGV